MDQNNLLEDDQLTQLVPQIIVPIQGGCKKITQHNDSMSNQKEGPTRKSIPIYLIMGGYTYRRVTSLEAHKKLLREVSNQMPCGLNVLETKTYIYNGWYYTMFLRPTSVYSNQESWKDNLIIFTTIKSFYQGRPDFTLRRILVYIESFIDLLY